MICDQESTKKVIKSSLTKKKKKSFPIENENNNVK